MIIQKLKQAWEKHGWSIIHTFLGAFLIALLPVIDQIDVNNLEVSAVIGLAVAVTRQAIKVVLQYVIAQFFTKK